MGKEMSGSAAALFGRLCQSALSMALVLLAETAALADTCDYDPGTAAGWAWTKIKEGKPADFNGEDRCNTPQLLAARVRRANKACRLLPATFIVEVLTKASCREQGHFAGVHIIGAHIEGDIDLHNAHIDRELWIQKSRIKGNVTLNEMRTDSGVSFDHSRVEGAFSAFQFRSTWSLSLADTEFKRTVTLVSAKIDGYVSMKDAKFKDYLNAEWLQVGGHLLVSNAKLKGVGLERANIADYVDLSGTKLDGDLNAESLRVGGHLWMRGTRTERVSVARANIAGDVDLTGATVDDGLTADTVQIGGHLFMRSGTFHDVDLRKAKITGQVDMSAAHFGGGLNAESVQIGDSLFMMGARFRKVNLNRARIRTQVAMINADFQDELSAEYLEVGADLVVRDSAFAAVDAPLAKIGSILEVSSAGFAMLNLTKASIGELSVRNMYWQCNHAWWGDMSLEDSKIGRLAERAAVWPRQGHLHLNGVSFAGLGSFQPDDASTAGTRNAEEWDRWFRLDSKYSPYSYHQIAAAFEAAGDRGSADSMRYFGRVREQEQSPWKSQLWQWALRLIAGFGIYPYWVFLWVGAIAFASAAYLRMFVKIVHKQRHGIVWCFSLVLAWFAMVLEFSSIVKLRELTESGDHAAEFFKDPKNKRLNWIEKRVFSAIRYLVWILGAIAVGAAAGAAGKP